MAIARRHPAPTAPALRPEAVSPAPRRPSQMQGGEHSSYPAPFAQELPIHSPLVSQSTQTRVGVAAAFTKEPPQSPPPAGAPPLNRGLLGNVVPTGPLWACARAPPDPRKLPLPAKSQGGRYLGDSRQGILRSGRSRAGRTKTVPRVNFRGKGAPLPFET